MRLPAEFSGLAILQPRHVCIEGIGVGGYNSEPSRSHLLYSCRHNIYLLLAPPRATFPTRANRGDAGRVAANGGVH